MTQPSDEALLIAYRDGDSGAFEALLGRYRRPVFNFVLRLVKDHGRAEELYQDIWLRVIERCDDFRGDAKFSTWLYAIARNLCVDHQRKMRFRTHASLDAPNPGPGRGPGERLGNPGPSAEELAMAGSTRERIARAVQALPEEQREVFLLRQLQGLAFHEIAEVVGTPTNTVKSRMRYALQRLQVALGDLQDHEL
ncbi:MAG: RNA polymerase sigma factor [Myxococcales bacterium]